MPDIKLTEKQKEVIDAMRKGVNPWIYMGRYMIYRHEVRASAIQKLIDNDLIAHKTEGAGLFELTELGKNIKL